MCGIVGYIGPEEASPFLLDGLNRLEYRGYDSAGLAVLQGNTLSVTKRLGRLKELESALKEKPLAGNLGVGHTRWATHGSPSKSNSHPHCSESGAIAVVHNGIIENFQELKDKLTDAGYTFTSETDTEVLPHLIDYELNHGATDFADAVRKALQQARGAYALGIVSKENPDTLYAARLGSPLVVGLSKNALFIASDVPAILNHVSKAIYLEDGEIVCLHKDGTIHLSTLDGKKVEPDIQKITLQQEAADKAGFETFMLKEVHEQPRTIRALVEKHTTAAGISLEGDKNIFKGVNRAMVVSCGTAFYAGMYGRLILEQMTTLQVETDLASEFRYRGPRLDEKTLIVAVSQSGETADTLASIKLAKDHGCKILSICNVAGSSVVRESDAVFYTEAGPEIGVASTKAYTAQLLAFILLAIHAGKCRGELSTDLESELVASLKNLPDAIHYVLDRTPVIEAIADKHHDGPSALYLGRKFNYPTALEGALKNKEISYQHAEGYAAGEMKHGPIALINEYLPVICLCTKTRDAVYEKMISNMKEVQARSGRIIAVATDGDSAIQEIAEDVIYVPETMDELSPIINVVALQLLAYYAAKARGTDIDKPRNLAKSVTVE